MRLQFHYHFLIFPTIFHMVPKKWGRGGNSWIIHVLVCKLRKTFAATKSGGGGGGQPVPLIVRAWFTWHVWWCLSRYVASFLKAGGDLTSKKLNFLTLNFPQKGGSSFKIQLSIYEKLKFCCEKRAPPPFQSCSAVRIILRSS